MANWAPKPEDLAPLVHLVRGEKVLLDSDLAELYDVGTKVLNQAVKGKLERFPADFMFQLSAEEWARLRSQLVTSNSRGGARYPPFAFSEQGSTCTDTCTRQSPKQWVMR